MNDALREFEPDSIIFIGSSPDLVVPLTLATSLESSGVSVRFVSHEIHDVLARAGLYDRAGIAFVSPKRRPLHAFFKRTFDLAASAVILLVASPVIAAIALAIKAESHGRVFFRQLRSLSPGGPRVSVYKFRSMKAASEDLSENISEIEGRRDLLFKLKDDPRITRIGKFIRKFSLDELPQLLNVVRGEMSLVGPRPLPVPDYGRIVGDETVRMLCDRRSLAKPGMTGLWQVSGRSNLTFREMVILDLYYAENQAILFDLEILLQTIPAVLSGRNAY
jgi:lipopolysaccharide/colanic/teichoic acid biosynthesis glycosyltransferase